MIHASQHVIIRTDNIDNLFARISRVIPLSTPDENPDGPQAYRVSVVLEEDDNE